MFSQIVAKSRKSHVHKTTVLYKNIAFCYKTFPLRRVDVWTEFSAHIAEKHSYYTFGVDVWIITPVHTLYMDFLK